MSQATRSPLTWPTGWARTPVGRRWRAKFGRGQRHYRSDGTPSYMGKAALSVADATGRLLPERDRLGAGNAILSTNLILRNDGLPRSDQREPADPGAAVSFDVDRPTVLVCDKWDRVADNIAAIALHIKAMRGMERWGCGSLAQAFAGYAALPPKGGETDWRVVLGMNEAVVTLEQMEMRYRALARRQHPDVGGDPEMMARLNAARDAARTALA